MNGQTPMSSRFQRWHVELPHEEAQDAWLLTYLDMLTLLLVMMVIMLTLAGQADGNGSGVESTPGAAIIGDPLALPSAGLPIAPIVATPANAGSDLTLIEAPSAPAAESPADGTAAPALLRGLGEDIEVIVNEGSISFRISSEILFGSGQAELEDAGLEVIDRLIPALASNRHRILVEGHTDDRPIRTERFPSNWELSASRASSVVRYLQLSGIDAARMSATGFADTRPLGDNSSESGRASNRRVELVMQTRAE